jgi:hypothetical protein
VDYRSNRQHEEEVQDRYVADVGDYAKFGLLRSLAATTEFSSQLTVAIIWYLMPNETHNLDGKHTQYVYDERLRACDPDLHDRLSTIARRGVRSISSLETSGILPVDRTIYYSETVPNGEGHRWRRLQPDARKLWFATAMNVSESADLVFLDPDNGLAGVSVPYSSTRAAKYAFLEEVQKFVERRQSILIYQHHHRQTSTQAQVTLALERQRSIVTPGINIFSFTFRRGSVRSFYLMSANIHNEAIRYNVGVVTKGPWAAFFAISGHCCPVK